MFLLEKLEMITLVCGLAAGIAAAAVLIKFNLHMFQLNGYKNGEHLHWIKKNARQFRILTLDGVLALAAVLLVLTRWCKPTKGLHPIVFILASAIIGVVFSF